MADEGTTDDDWVPPRVMVTVDLVILTVRAGRLDVLLIERGIEPYADRLALPGGFIANEHEDTVDAADRELREETGLDSSELHLEQLGAYATPDRDPRGRVITVAYLAIAPDLPAPTSGGDARNARWQSAHYCVENDSLLAFDHHRILSDGLDRAIRKLEHTSLATQFCPEPFTIADLRRVYEAVWNASLDPRNFHRKVSKTSQFVIPIGRKRNSDTGRPAELYRRGPATTLYPPMLRERASTH